MVKALAGLAGAEVHAWTQAGNMAMHIAAAEYGHVEQVVIEGAGGAGTERTCTPRIKQDTRRCISLLNDMVIWWW